MQRHVFQEAPLYYNKAVSIKNHNELLWMIYFGCLLLFVNHNQKINKHVMRTFKA